MHQMVWNVRTREGVAHKNEPTENYHPNFNSAWQLIVKLPGLQLIATTVSYSATTGSCYQRKIPNQLSIRLPDDSNSAKFS